MRRRDKQRQGQGWMRKKKKKTDELMVVKSDYRVPGLGRFSCCLWDKKIKSIKMAEEASRQIQSARRWRNQPWIRQFRHSNRFNDDTKVGFCKGVAVRLYAKVGLHRYNLLENTNLQLHIVDNYTRLGRVSPFSTYCITSFATAAAPPDPLVTFQTRVHEEGGDSLNLTCYLAAPENTGPKCILNKDEFRYRNDSKPVPQWPLHDAFPDENHRFFYKLQESEWEDNDWIRLYLELALVTTNRHILNMNLTNLKILNVVVETEENMPKESVLKCYRNLIVYIRYDQDLGEDGVCKWRAIVRRTIDLVSKHFYLVGTNLKVPV